MIEDMPTLVRLCHKDEIAEGKACGFSPTPAWPRKVIVACRNGRLFGWLDACPHYAGGTPMAWKTNAYLNGEGTHLACHSHGALFEVETGECTLGPCLGQRLTKVELVISANGDICVPDHPVRRIRGSIKPEPA